MMEKIRTIALIGADGAGKTTIAKILEKSSLLRVKYLYMGLSTRSSNVALPTSRLVLYLKKHSYRKKLQKEDTHLEEIPASFLEYSEAKHGSIWVAARFLNRFAEAWYRLVISSIYQFQGYCVVYDRYFLFDASIDGASSKGQKPGLLDRIYYWSLKTLYPRPDLVIFLDAPVEQLYLRKQDTTPDCLNEQRLAFLEEGRKMQNFVRIDASQPLESVVNEVIQQILNIKDLKHEVISA